MNGLANGRVRWTAIGIALGVGMAAATAWVGASADSRLSRSEMGRLRGGNPYKFTGLFSCDQRSGIANCESVDQPCGVCGTSTDYDVGPDAGDGFKRGYSQAGDCGKVLDGVCNSMLQCISAGTNNTGWDCRKPPGLPLAQAAIVGD